MWNTTFDEKNKVWKGNDLPSCDPNLSIASVILNSLKSGGSEIAQINGTSGISVTFDDIRIRTIRAAKNLQKRGLSAKQIYGFVTKNHDDLASLVFASFSLGCTIYPIHPDFTKYEIVQKYQKIRPKVIFCDIGAYDIVVQSLTELKHTATIFTFDGEKDGSENVENLFEVVDDDTDITPVAVDGVNELAAIYCSSGTTGPSKGICMSHSMLINTIAASYDWKLGTKRVSLNVYPLQWFRSLHFLLAGTIYHAIRVIISEEYSPQRTFHLIGKYNVSRFMSSPIMLKTMIHSDSIKAANFSSLENIILGGYRLPYEIGKIMDGFLPNGTVNNRYGLTELGGTVSIEVPKFSKGSAGKLKSGNVAKIVDENGKRLGVNEQGEICVKSMSMTSGYYQEELLTAKSFDEEGFFLTGDIGYFDEEGDLLIVDRKKDTFKYNGYVVSPSEIESVLLQSPQISMACVFSTFDINGKEVPAVAIIRATNTNITAEEISQLLSVHFYDRNILAGGIYFVDSIPKTPSGKNLRRKMREIVLQLSTEQ
ncbi:4-coumarate--CoA ligase 1-like isoform X2 [Bradysia coprophila]|uniref:4-coumarate--CoA ligase 1-like isoform X2 n=1 Tax=Bradysia coprophila TaxID=38358 RepID=UPI00187DCC97|nr:4-coumarate--CoA ligase 1-like isoform X2 [Bradysia coprophila]